MGVVEVPQVQRVQKTVEVPQIQWVILYVILEMLMMAKSWLRLLTSNKKVSIS